MCDVYFMYICVPLCGRIILFFFGRTARWAALGGDYFLLVRLFLVKHYGSLRFTVEPHAHSSRFHCVGFLFLFLWRILLYLSTHVSAYVLKAGAARIHWAVNLASSIWRERVWLAPHVNISGALMRSLNPRMVCVQSDRWKAATLVGNIYSARTLGKELWCGYLYDDIQSWIWKQNQEGR